MPTYTSYDSAELAYHEHGSGPPLLVIPGGPARDAAYLGDLLALGHRDRIASSSSRTCAAPGRRSPTPIPPPTAPTGSRPTWRCSSTTCAPARVDVLAHSAGANVALLVAERRPDLVSRLVLVTPGTRAVGLDPADAEWEAALERRAGEPWYDDLRAALEAEEPTPEQQVESEAMFYGRWDDAARCARRVRSAAAQRGRHGLVPRGRLRPRAHP